RGEHGVGEEQLRVEVPKEQALGEAERLRAGEEQLLGLLLLLLDLCGGQAHWAPRGLGESTPPPFYPPEGAEARQERKAVRGGRGTISCSLQVVRCDGGWDSVYRGREAGGRMLQVA